MCDSLATELCRRLYDDSVCVRGNYTYFFRQPKPIEDFYGLCRDFTDLLGRYSLLLESTKFTQPKAKSFRAGWAHRLTGKPYPRNGIALAFPQYYCFGCNPIFVQTLCKTLRRLIRSQQRETRLDPKMDRYHYRWLQYPHGLHGLLFPHGHRQTVCCDRHQSRAQWKPASEILHEGRIKCVARKVNPLVFTLQYISHGDSHMNRGDRSNGYFPDSNTLPHLETRYVSTAH